MGKISGGVAAGLMFLTFIFTIVGLAGPWWTADEYGMTIKMTLWKTEGEAYGQSNSADHADTCDDVRDGCKGFEDSELCEGPLKNCLLVQLTGVVVIFAFICVLVAFILDVAFVVLLCAKGGTQCCSKCCGMGGIVLTVIGMVLSLISLALAAGVETDKLGLPIEPDLNGAGFACMVLAFIFCLICTVLSCISVCTAPVAQA
jgi:hypothetical protein